MKKRYYYIIWIEGIEYFRGEKVKCLTNNGYDITTKMTEAMRVKPEDLNIVKNYLSRHGVADWVLENSESFVRTNYAPSGTLLNLKRIAI